MKSQYRIVQIGCGIVGKAYIDAYKKENCHVIGIEYSEHLVEKYSKEMEIYHTSDNMSTIKKIDFIMVSVCTPLKGDKLDLSYIFNTIDNVAQIVKNSPDVLVILRSTIPPKTTRVYKNKLETIVGQDVNVIFQPEFLRAESALEDAKNPWHIVFGVDENMDIFKLIDLYSRFIEKDRITIMKIEEAELLKIFHNCYNATKISFTNQCYLLNKAISKELEIDIDSEKIMSTMVKTCEGLLNPKYGTKPGHAYYGSCLPKDSKELSFLENQYKLIVPFFDSVVKINNEMKKLDGKEILNGDFHMSFNKLKENVIFNTTVEK